MLVLTRYTGQSIIVGDNITFTILSVRGNQVRIGVDAPKDVPVHRDEVYEKIHNITPDEDDELAESECGAR